MSQHLVNNIQGFPAYKVETQAQMWSLAWALFLTPSLFPPSSDIQFS